MSLALAAMACAGLTSCEKDAAPSLSVQSYRIDEEKGAISGIIVYNQQSDAIALGEADSQDPHMKDLAKKVLDVHETLMRELDSKFTNRQYLNRIKDIFAARNIIVSETRFKGEGDIQKMGDAHSSLEQDFIARNLVVTGDMAASEVRFSVPRLGEGQEIRIQKGISNPRQLEATIAHELGHMYFDRLFPGLMHDSTDTADGYVSGKALSEGMALFAERLYLCATSDISKGSEFSNFHPLDTPSAPYGEYSLYFLNECTSVPMPQHDVKLPSGDAVRINAEYLNLRSQLASLEGIRKGVNEADRSRVPGSSGAVFFDLRHTPSEYAAGGVLRPARSVRYYGPSILSPVPEADREKLVEAYTKEIKAIEPQVRDICREVLAAQGAATPDAFPVASILSGGDAPGFTVSPMKDGFRTNFSLNAFFTYGGYVPGAPQPATMPSVDAGRVVIHRTTLSGVELQVGPMPGAGICDEVTNHAAFKTNLAARGLVAQAIRQSDLAHMLAVLYCARCNPLADDEALRLLATRIEGEYIRRSFPVIGDEGANAIMTAKQHHRQMTAGGSEGGTLRLEQVWPRVDDSNYINPLHNIN